MTVHNQHIPIWQRIPALGFLWLSFVAIHFSTAISSISLGLFFVFSWVQKKAVNQSVSTGYSGLGWSLIFWFLVLILRAFFGACLIYFNHTLHPVGFVECLDFAGFFKEIQQKSPLLLLGIGCLHRITCKWEISKNWMWLLLPFFWIISASCWNYFQHFKFYSQMVLESKPIPMYSQVYHIEFGAMAGIVLLIPVYEYLVKGAKQWRWGNWVFWVWGITVVGFHVLALRTGLVLFYLGMAMIAIAWLKKDNGSARITSTKKYRYLYVGIFCLIVTSFLVPSIRNRLVNTWQDISGVVKGTDANHRSVGQRVWAWKAALGVIEEEPMGAGIDGEFNAMMHQYDVQKIPLQIQHRIGVHNQWLETATQSGWIAVFVMLYFYWRLVIGKFELMWMSLMGYSMVIESMLERQAGMLLFAFLLVFTVSLPLKNRKKEEVLENIEGIS